ncbi:alpha/beta fold hydrolase [Haloactinomyces albus]|uniref:2-hydroxy-6-oxonona-2,4-dienedioate hydrolase n=1 Tax=Haloactinomyces albus TaxID=1352928 RepID=A0AAE3ZFA2_9ACTN|nr:alpha/beta fold hydrolase [Haloactinomyces albus]MDR7303888.1 2-hydroxy-6-oxonona-2,4-dienedioate hydrolase [Haloactinomyces albus]
MPEPTYESTLRELRTDQGVLRYHEAGDGPPLLMLHGSGPGVSGWQNFSGNLPVFAEHFRCLVLEFPGFGASDSTGEHPMAAAAPAVPRFLDGLGLSQVDVIGNSMGGIIAAQTAIGHPDRIRRLVTVGGMGRNLFSPGPGEGINLLMEFAEDPTRERLVQWLNSMVHDRSMVTEELIEQRWRLATDPESLASARRMYGRGALEARAAAAENSDAPPTWAMLHKIKARTMITWGRDDRVSPLDMAIVPMRTIPDVELHVFPDCGHWAMIEQKQAWESAVLAFLLRKDNS